MTQDEKAKNAYRELRAQVVRAQLLADSILRNKAYKFNGYDSDRLKVICSKLNSAVASVTALDVY